MPSTAESLEAESVGEGLDLGGPIESSASRLVVRSAHTGTIGGENPNAALAGSFIPGCEVEARAGGPVKGEQGPPLVIAEVEVGEATALIARERAGLADDRLEALLALAEHGQSIA